MIRKLKLKSKYACNAGKTKENKRLNERPDWHSEQSNVKKGKKSKIKGMEFMMTKSYLKNWVWKEAREIIGWMEGVDETKGKESYK